MTPVAACRNHHSCLARRDEIFRKPTCLSWNDECICCVEGFARRMDNFAPDPDIEPYRLRTDGTHTPGTKPQGACGRGHLRSVHGRRIIHGRDAGGWACKECERIRREKYKARRR